MGPQRRDADKKALRNNNLPRAQPPGESCAPRACIFHERARVSWPHFASSFRRAARSHHDARLPSPPHQQPRLTRDSKLSSRSRGCGGGHVDGKFKRRLAVECLVIRARAGRHNGVEGGDIAFARFSRTWPWQHRAHDGSLDTQRQRARQPRPRPRQRRRAPPAFATWTSATLQRAARERRPASPAAPWNGQRSLLVHGRASRPRVDVSETQRHALCCHFARAARLTTRQQRAPPRPPQLC